MKSRICLPVARFLISPFSNLTLQVNNDDIWGKHPPLIWIFVQLVDLCWVICSNLRRYFPLLYKFYGLVVSVVNLDTEFPCPPMPFNVTFDLSEWGWLWRHHHITLVVWFPHSPSAVSPGCSLDRWVNQWIIPVVFLTGLVLDLVSHLWSGGSSPWKMKICLPSRLRLWETQKLNVVRKGFARWTHAIQIGEFMYNVGRMFEASFAVPRLLERHRIDWFDNCVSLWAMIRFSVWNLHVSYIL